MARGDGGVGRSILVIVWALLSDEQAQFVDLGPDYYASRTHPERRVRHHVREREALGCTVTLNRAARPRRQGFSDQAASETPAAVVQELRLVSQLLDRALTSSGRSRWIQWP